MQVLLLLLFLLPPVDLPPQPMPQPVVTPASIAARRVKIVQLLNEDADDCAILSKEIEALNGVKGTVEALRLGRQGPQGPPGIQGPRGEKGDKGDPGTGPPVPPKPTLAKHVTFISPTAETAGIVNDTVLRAWLKEAGVAVHVIAAGDSLPAGFSEAIAAAGGVPAFVVQGDGGKLLSQGKLTTVQAVKDAIK